MASPENQRPRRSTDAASPSARRHTSGETAESSNSINTAQETRPDNKSRTTSTTAVQQQQPSKRRKNRNRKRRHRRESFLAPEESHSPAPVSATAPAADAVASASVGAADQSKSKSRARLPFYQLGRDLSDTSLESEALLDHRYVLIFFLLHSTDQMILLNGKQMFF